MNVRGVHVAFQDGDDVAAEVALHFVREVGGIRTRAKSLYDPRWSRRKSLSALRVSTRGPARPGTQPRQTAPPAIGAKKLSTGSSGCSQPTQRSISGRKPAWSSNCISKKRRARSQSTPCVEAAQRVEQQAVGREVVDVLSGHAVGEFGGVEAAAERVEVFVEVAEALQRFDAGNDIGGVALGERQACSG